jgi:hypothetical protein
MSVNPAHAACDAAVTRVEADLPTQYHRFPSSTRDGGEGDCLLIVVQDLGPRASITC